MRTGIKHLFAAAVVGSFGLTANAAMSVTFTRTAGSGTLAGFDIVRFFAAADPNGPEKTQGATGLFLANVELQTNNNFKYLTGQFAPPNNGAANPDIDLYGAQMDDTLVRTTNDDAGSIGTYVGLRDPDFDQFFVAGLTVDGVAQGASKPNSNGATNNPSTFFASVKSFRVEGIVNNTAGTPAGDTQVFTPNVGQTGAGAIFAVAVVPTGSTVRALGTIGADKGPTTDFDTVPEPTSLGFIGITAVGLLARRRRTA